MNFIHNDLKLENILVGREDPNQIYLIDFGLATRWRDPMTNRHACKVQTHKFSGNFRFATKNQCQGFKTSRRDDIQSAFYILIYLLNKNRLPWQDPDLDQDGADRSVKWLKKRAKKSYNRELVQMAPQELRECLIAVLSLKFRD